MDDVAVALGELVGRLESAGLTYALGGAAANAIWGVPRATLAIDLNVWCAPDALEATMAALIALGVEGDAASAAQQGASMGVAYLRWRGIRLDVFVPSIDFYDEALRTRVRVQLPGIGAAWVLSAEAIAVFKMLFFRPKDLIDLDKMVRVRGADLDHGYVRRQLVALVGEDDERISRWDAMTLPRA